MLIGYLHRAAVVVSTEQAARRRDADVAAMRQRGAEEVADLLGDLGVWAALTGIDAVAGRLSVVIGQASAAARRIDRHYLVLNRAAMLVETAEPRVTDLWAGERHVSCRCGERHFGTYGAAGLLVVHRAEDGSVRMLMQRRSDAVQHGGTWSLLGGARGLRETARRAAMREAWEEAGLDPSTYTLGAGHVDDHGDWSYTTVLAETGSPVTVRGRNAETAEVAWVSPDELGSLALHPGFAASWPAVSAALLGTTYPLHAPSPDPPRPDPADPDQTPRAGIRETGIRAAFRRAASAIVRRPSR